MAEAKDAEVKKKGFFSRKKSEPAPATARPAQPAPRTAAAPKAATPPVEPRLSLESMPEVERRIDRMHATERRASLLERYENRYGEKLDVPRIFLPVEAEKAETPAPAKAEPPAAAIPAAKAAAAAEAKPAAAPVAPKPAAPALPPKDVKAPEPKPVAAAPKPSVASVPAAKPATPEAKPAVPKVKKPNPVSGKSFWKYFWNPLKLPFRDLAKYYNPENKGVVIGATVGDIVIWPFLTLVRVLGPLYIGIALGYLKKRKARQANGEKTEVSAATN